MNSSGIKRGLAVSAVAALAVTGLSTSASATTINTQAGTNNVVLYSQSSGGTAIKNDGVNGTVRLEAGAGSAVSQVTFQYRVGAGAWQDIATVSRNDDGAFSTEWDVPGAILNVAGDVRAINAADANVNDSAAVTFNTIAGAESVALKSGSALGVYQVPGGTVNKVIVNGTASSTGAVDVYRINGTTGAGVGVPTPITPAADKSFSGVLDLGAYPFDASASPVDEVVLGATANGGNSDAVEAYTLYKQKITTVTAVSDKASLPLGQTATVTVTVKDQNGNPIAGAEVAEGTSPRGITNEKGEVTVPSVSAGTHTYYANADTAPPTAPAYDAVAGDVKAADVVIAAYNPNVASLKGISTDGPAFDLDENVLADVKVQVLDQNGTPNNAANGQSVQYYWSVTPFAGGTPVRTPAETAPPTGPTLSLPVVGNSVDIPLPAGNVEGTYELFAGLQGNGGGNNAIASSKVLTFKAGQADVKLDDADLNAPIGGSVTATGVLSLDDGTVLPARNLDLSSYTNGGANSTVDAATPLATLKTDAAGKFSVKINDPATPATTELNNPLIVNGTGFAPGANASISFVTDQAPANAVLTVNADGAAANTPGVIQAGTLNLKDAGNNPLAGVQVKLTADHGFFTNGTAVSTANGALDGEFKNLGTSITVVTDASGNASFKTVIGRDAGFDVNGTLTAGVKAEVASVNTTSTIAWNTQNPLNVGEVTVTRLPNQLSPQQTGNQVNYDLTVEDQFGNPVSGAGVTVSKDASLDPNTASKLSNSPSATSDFITDGDIWVDSDIAGEYSFDVKSTTGGHAYAGGTVVPVPASAATEITEKWYEVDLDASAFTLTAPATATVGDTVLVTANAVDQEGNALTNVEVEFVRSGDANQIIDVDANGDAVYAFKGTEAGTQSVTAVFRNGTGGTVLKTEVVSVDFVKAAGAVKAKLIGFNASKKKDALQVSTNADKGTLVKFFRVTKSGKKKLVAERFVNANGRADAKVADKNGKKVTTYIANVLANAGKVTTNKKKVK